VGAYEIEGRNPSSDSVIRLRLIAESPGEAKRLAESCGLVAVSVRAYHTPPGFGCGGNGKTGPSEPRP
jgi:hypothetical protein